MLSLENQSSHTDNRLWVQNHQQENANNIIYYNERQEKGYVSDPGEKSPRIDSGSSLAISDMILSPALLITSREGRR